MPEPSSKTKMSGHIAQSFTAGFLAQSLAKQIADCDRYELAFLFLKLFRDQQPVLEAGCGSGRWCGWFHKNGICSDGVDWSQELCDRAAQELAGSRFVACGRLAGKWNSARSAVDLTVLGKLLRKIIPVFIMGHMLCYVVKKAG